MRVGGGPLIQLILWALLFCDPSSLLGTTNCLTQLNSLSSAKRLPRVLTENSDAQLIDTMKAVMELFEVKRSSTIKSPELEGPRLISIPENFPRSLKNKKGISIHLDPLYAIFALVYEAAHRELDLPPHDSRVFAFHALKASAAALNLSVHSVVSKSLSELQETSTHTDSFLSDQALSSATRLLFQKFSIQDEGQRFCNVYDIPGLAGYSISEPLKPYIDRDLLRVHKLKNGQMIDVYVPLLVHEVFEKALMNVMRLSHNVYFRTHQLAQRLEKAVVIALGFPWNEYQKVIMHREIDRVTENKQSLYPFDLDWAPQKDYWRLDILRAIEKKAKGRRVFRSEVFEAYELTPGIIHLRFYDQKKMAYSMMRFQEHYESPQFRQRVFSRKEFLNWRKSKGGDPYSSWDGFNLPGDSLTPFIKGQFPLLTSDEKKILHAVEPWQSRKFYLIATTTEPDPLTLLHEFAHALYASDPHYRFAVDQILSKIDLRPLQRLLVREYGDYHRDVLHDESHAWLIFHAYDLEDLGLNLKPYVEARDHLERAFLAHALESLRAASTPPL